MVATFVIDWPVLLLLGIVFGGLVRHERWWGSAAFRFGVVVAVAFTAVALLSYAIAPEWMWMYFLDPGDVVWVVWLMPLGYLFTFVVGFAAAVALRRIGSGYVAAAALAAVVAEVVVVAATWDRYRAVGTAAEWRAGDAHDLVTAAPTGPARTIGMMGAAFLVVLVGALYLTRRSDASASDR